MTRTRKPCPGCGESVGSRAADKVCRECQDLIKEARAARARAKRVKELETVMLPFAPHRLAHIPHLFYGSDEKASDAIQKAFFEIVELIGERVSEPSKAEEFAPVYRDGFGGHNQFWRVPQGLRPICHGLYETIIRAVEIARESGYRDGHNLIVGLASGKVSIDGFNQATIGETAQPKRKRGRR